VSPRETLVGAKTLAYDRRMRTVVLVVLIAGCSSTTRGTVDVAVYDNTTPTPTAIVGATVAFEDPDGTIATAMTDENGAASGEVADQGSVWIQIGVTSLVAYTDVHPPASLVGGAPPPATHATIATMAVTGTPPASDGFVVYSSCGTATATGIAFDDRCSQPITRLLAVAFTTHDPDPIYTSYAYFPNQQIHDGGTIAIADTSWQPPDEVTVQLTRLEGGTAATTTLPRLANDFGASQPATASNDGTTITGAIPLVGDHVRLFIPLQRGSDFEQIYVVEPTTSAPLVDFYTVGAPWIDEPDASGSFSLDDGGGFLVSDLAVTTYAWTADHLPVQLEMIGPPVTQTGTVAPPQLPAPWAYLQPNTVTPIDEHVRAIRIDSTTEPAVVVEESHLENLADHVPDDFLGVIAATGEPE